MSTYVASARPVFHSSSIVQSAIKERRWVSYDSVKRDVTVRKATPKGILPLAERRKRALSGY